MYYVKERVSDGYEILDSQTGEVNTLSIDDIEEMELRGIHIKGVAFIKGVLTVTPVPPLYTLNKVDLARNKLVRGSATGVLGFDLEVVGDRVIAKPLSSDFVEYVKKHKTGYNFVLSIPDIVTDISPDFLKGCIDNLERINIALDLPSSLITIGSYALCGDMSDIENIIFNGVVESIGEGNPYRPTCELETQAKYINIKVRNIAKNSIDLYVNSSTTLDLSDTEVLKSQSITRGIKNLNIILGTGIKYVGNFLSPILSDEYKDFVDIVYIPDNCQLREVDIDSNDNCNDLFCFNTYIAVMSDSTYDDLCERYRDNRLVITHSKSRIRVGIVTYSNQVELSDIRSRLRLIIRSNDNWVLEHTYKDPKRFTRLRASDILKV